MRPRTTARKPVMLGHAPQQRRHKPDYILILTSVILLVVGLIVIYSISPGLAVQRNVSESYYISKQATAIGVGLITFFIAASISLKLWRVLTKPLIGIALGVTLLALILPVTPEYPAHRWVRFAGLSLQAVEVIKFALIFWLAGFLTQRIQEGTIKRGDKTFKPLLILLAVIGLTVAILQSDLGSMGVLVVVIGTMCFVAGLPLKKTFILLGIIALGTTLAISTSDYRRERFMTFLQPERDCQDAGYQACQALIAVGSGGLVGKGVAHSVQAYGYLPEASNDSIFAIIAEKFGFFGTSLLIVVFGVFFARIKSIIERAPDTHSRLVVVGVLAWLSTQTLINIGAMIGLLPLKGITLPFISYGGTSIIFVMAALGVVFNISRYTTYAVNTDASEGSRYESTSYRGRNRRPHYAAVSRRP